MATGQTLLNLMELLNQELQLQSGEADVTRGLIALNAAQDQFESLAAVRKGILGGQTANVATVAQTESTSYPAGFMRIDRIQTLNGTTSRPDGELRPLSRAGGHAFVSSWPANLVSSSSTGKPQRYWTDGTNIYWAPLPDTAYTCRVYGFKSAADITAAGTFAYTDAVMLPMAGFAARLLKIGLDDSAGDLASIAQESFKSVLDQLENFRRDSGSTGFDYTDIHDT
jgi:hypothetical protein